MEDLKISLITVTLNAENSIGRCIESVIAQNFDNVEYIIIDGGSADNTVKVINKYKDHIDLFITEPDKGIYDAINKGIRNANGSIVGILNSDDFFAGNDILSSVASLFELQNSDIVYGNLDYVNREGDIVRAWRSGGYKSGIFNWGWMPPHPTFYCKKNLYEHLGYYSLEYGTAADYELMIRFMHLNQLKISYLDKTMVKMSIGGVSNQHYINRIKAWRHDCRAMRNNGINFPLATIIFKPARKIFQFSLLMSKKFR